MKNLGVTLAIMFLAAGVTASAQNVTAINQTSGNTLPGQGGTVDPDYTFLGAFNPGGGNGAQELTDFSQSEAGGGSALPAINAPAGSFDGNGNPITMVTPQATTNGEEFFSQSPEDIVDFTVRSSAASAYNLSAAFGAVNNGDNGELIDGSFTITLVSATGVQLSTATLAVTDNNTSSTNDLFANFSISGLVAGDVIHVLVTPAQSATNVQAPYVGAVGFTPEAAPEPSTYAMMFAGLGALVLFARRKLA